MLYFGFADARLTSVRPSFSRFFRTISAFCPFTSGMVSCLGAALVLSALGSANAEGWVTVTVDEEVPVWLPHADKANAAKIAATDAIAQLVRREAAAPGLLAADPLRPIALRPHVPSMFLRGAG
jgi:hypothetical protein